MRTNASTDLAEVSDIENQSGVESLAQQWAKKYMQNLQPDANYAEGVKTQNLAAIVSSAGRAKTAQKILESLRSVSAKAWNQTEALLAEQVKLHSINPNLINPWEIAGDSFNIYQKALAIYSQQPNLQPLAAVMQLAQAGNPLYEQALALYSEQVAPNQLTTVVGGDIGAMRKKYTSQDPRVIGFVTMQFHYTSQMLLELLEPIERSLIGAYFKVIDDHLYMPLQRAYEAAAQHDYDSTIMSAVRKLLPMSTQIAKKIFQQVIELYPNYRCFSGNLSDPLVKISSIRDVEMFQVYLWVCALEGNITAVQEELFPLCIMLYPRLKVDWDLVRQMLVLLKQEIETHLTPAENDTLIPYLQALWKMFSTEVIR
ncbi:hypothetical protein H6G33_12710 [Calothrix sp. FACHB-1219]|uniref:hypothetical protein n=1 Tax=unclassified Calothrix TaxID=2619626 RepID=UPI0016879E6F|nr:MULTISPECIES: hypothetical protein [unclassified Calothrix]MBD2202516.1 hypothetical protein [Calothrix sp. FACHB-168]MBD2217893.1 hypothetical protein [Calothrix sp. FACHB-1219]